MSIHEDIISQWSRIADENIAIRDFIHNELDGMLVDKIEILKSEMPLTIPVTFQIHLFGTVYDNFDFIGEEIDMSSLDGPTVLCKSGESYFGAMVKKAKRLMDRTYHNVA